MEDNEIIKSLSQIPELIDTIRFAIESNTKMQSLFAESLKRQIEATVSEDERRKLATDVSDAVAKTRCAVPEMSDVAHEIANGVCKEINSTVHDSVLEATRKTIKDNPVKFEHHHIHTTLEHAYEFSKGYVHNMLVSLTVFCALGILVGAVLGIKYFTGEEYVGRQYKEIYFSKYATDEEKKMLYENAYHVSFLPTEYSKDPVRVRQIIRHNRKIIKQREYEARSKKGSFSSNPPLER